MTWRESRTNCRHALITQLCAASRSVPITDAGLGERNKIRDVSRGYHSRLAHLADELHDEEQRDIAKLTGAERGDENALNKDEHDDETHMERFEAAEEKTLHQYGAFLHHVAQQDETRVVR